MAKKKITTSVKIWTTILCLLALIVGFIGAGYIYIYITKPESDVFVSGDFEVHFMELGNQYTGDCIYIRSGSTDILIDAGSRKNSADSIIEYVDNYVKDNTLEFVIATHADQDHIAAYEGIFERYEVETIIDFPLTNKTGKDETNILRTYYEYRDLEVENGAEHFTALECYNESVDGAQRIYQISDSVEMEILYNYYYENHSSDENNYSVCLMFNQGDNHYLFTGDLEGDGEEELLNYYNGSSEERYTLPHCVLYKAGHHGSNTSTTAELMAVVQPEYVIVCCCAGTSEYTTNKANQFPSQQFIDNIALYTDNVYIPTMINPDYVDGADSSVLPYTSMNGDIVFSVTNGEVELSFSNNDIKLKDTDWFKENREMPDAWRA